MNVAKDEQKSKCHQKKSQRRQKPNRKQRNIEKQELMEYNQRRDQHKQVQRVEPVRNVAKVIIVKDDEPDFLDKMDEYFAKVEAEDKRVREKFPSDKCNRLISYFMSRF